MNLPEDAAKLALRNRAAIKAASVCGCYFCLRTFPTSEVTEWADGGKTALCPHCELDALLPGVDKAESLAKCHEHWFTDPHDWLWHSRAAGAKA